MLPLRIGEALMNTGTLTVVMMCVICTLLLVLARVRHVDASQVGLAPYPEQLRFQGRQRANRRTGRSRACERLVRADVQGQEKQSMLSRVLPRMGDCCVNVTAYHNHHWRSHDNALRLSDPGRRWHRSHRP